MVDTCGRCQAIKTATLALMKSHPEGLNDVYLHIVALLYTEHLAEVHAA